MQAMVLAAGLGTRLWPLTCDRAKPAVPFLGRPLVAGVVELVLRHGIRRVVVNTHHRPGSVRRALAGLELGAARLTFSHEDEIMGTAGALALARDRGLLSVDEDTLVVNAKLVMDLDLRAAVATHRRSGCAVTMVLRPNTRRRAFREVVVEGERVVGFGAGRHPTGPDPLLFTGIHLIAPRVLATIPSSPCDTVADVYPDLVAAGEVAAQVVTGGRWWELSTPARYLEYHLRAHELGLGPDVVTSAGARVVPGADVHRAVLWEDATVEAGAVVDHAVLGAGVVIHAGERVASAVVVRRSLVSTLRGGEVWGDRVRVPIELPVTGGAR